MAWSRVVEAGGGDHEVGGAAGREVTIGRHWSAQAWRWWVAQTVEIADDPHAPDRARPARPAPASLRSGLGPL